MRDTCRSRQAMTIPAMALLAVMAFVPAAATADPASGTINYQSKAGPIVINVANVYMVNGPDAVSGKTIRQLIFTSADVSAKLQACASMMCASGNVTEGMTVDFDVRREEKKIYTVEANSVHAGGRCQVEHCVEVDGRL